MSFLEALRKKREENTALENEFRERCAKDLYNRMINAMAVNPLFVRHCISYNGGEKMSFAGRIYTSRSDLKYFKDFLERESDGNVICQVTNIYPTLRCQLHE